ncbi:hypothetical protein [Microbacterium gorillae]|uniref:hypothetical protein n=1 Tax=Microbacterium gorillae TaxID=1231063 RepID=UPI003D990188
MFDEPVYRVRDLSEMGFGHPQTIRERLRGDHVPFEVVDGRGTVTVRESDLPLLRKPRHRRNVLQERRCQPSGESTSNLEDLEMLAARMVASWPQLTSERKNELRKLLAS